MKLEQQVCSLELAKKLKELGVKQESVCYWRKIQLDGEFDNEIIWQAEPEMSYVSTYSHILESIAAFTVAEMGEMLPGNYEFTLYTNKGDGLFHLSGGGVVVELESIWADTEADARAKLLIYLIENNLLNK